MRALLCHHITFLGTLTSSFWPPAGLLPKGWQQPAHCICTASHCLRCLASSCHPGVMWQDAVDEGLNASEGATPARQSSFSSPGYAHSPYTQGGGSASLSPLSLGTAPKYQPSLQVHRYCSTNDVLLLIACMQGTGMEAHLGGGHSTRHVQALRGVVWCGVVRPGNMRSGWVG